MPETEMASYIKTKGVKCAFCQSDNLDMGIPQVCDCGEITVEVACNDCGAVIREFYTMTDAEVLKKGRSPAPGVASG